LGVLLGWVQRHGGAGALCLDDVIVERAFARRLRWAGWAYSHAKRRRVHGLHIVVLAWCDHGRRWRIPVAFRL
jgi:N-acyl-L-homoserine lactone synthetase